MQEEHKIALKIPEFERLVLEHAIAHVSNEDFQNFRNKTITSGQPLEDQPEPNSENMTRENVIQEKTTICFHDYKEHMHAKTKTGEFFVSAGLIDGQPILYSPKYGTYSWSDSPDGEEFLEIWLTYPAYPRPNTETTFAPDFEQLALRHAQTSLSDEQLRLLTGVPWGEPLPDRKSLIIEKSEARREMLYHTLKKARESGNTPLMIGLVIGEPVFFLPNSGTYLWSAFQDEYSHRSIELNQNQRP